MAPILFRLALHRRRCRVLEFEPILRSAGTVARAEPLRDDAFEAHLACVPEHRRAILVRDVLVQPQARGRLRQDGGERGLADLERVMAEIRRR
jgi:hypothetical protein